MLLRYRLSESGAVCASGALSGQPDKTKIANAESTALRRIAFGMIRNPRKSKRLGLPAPQSRASSKRP
jgi:hypothetical protein